ncbi:tyrosine-type recombinase/integrase [Salinicola acroporae]|uniref:Integrase n=1 Tax=Salinicola acroporae TaxID=1541440 RepID=A0ABT6I503_9GAMM|nr:site-specific integrase [Salinicola acroporae]MDH4572489.1 hypothetical protein [Salinicola acroporae]
MLNEKQLRALKPREKEFTLSDDGQRGVGRLQIRVRPGGAKDWLYVYYLNKRRRKVGIGAYPSISLADARRKAAELSGHLSDGDDPAKIVREKRAASETSYGTLGDLIQAYTADMKERGRNTADEVMERCQRYVKGPFPALWSKPAKEVTSGDIRDILAHHIKRGLTTTTNRLRSWLHTAYQYGLAIEHDPRRQSVIRWELETNPVSVVPRQADWERQGERVVSGNELSAAWHGLPQYSPAAMALRLVMTTAGQRPQSLLRLRVENIDFDQGIIEIPAAASKNGQPHVVPLNEYSRDILTYLCEKALARHSPLLFASPKNPDEHIGITSVPHLLGKWQRDGKRERWSPRDVRRTAKTVLGQLGVSKEDRDRLHGHAMHDVSSRHYDRYDYLAEKRAAMQVWAAWLNGVINQV